MMWTPLYCFLVYNLHRLKYDKIFFIYLFLIFIIQLGQNK